jgi:hypothetical protein
MCCISHEQLRLQLLDQMYLTLGNQPACGSRSAGRQHTRTNGGMSKYQAEQLPAAAGLHHCARQPAVCIQAQCVEPCTLQQLKRVATPPSLHAVVSLLHAVVPLPTAVVPPASPCATSPCDSKANAVIGSCVAQGGTQFSCSCSQGYTWNSANAACTGGWASGLSSPNHDFALCWLWGLTSALVLALALALASSYYGRFGSGWLCSALRTSVVATGRTLEQQPAPQIWVL